MGMTTANLYPCRRGRGKARFAPTGLVLVLLALLAFAAPVAAQDAGQGPVPRNDDAELIFEQALDAFEEENYGMAYRRFQLVVRDYRLHRKTTAALLMAGKALYRSGQYEQAVEVLSELINQYPSSSYLEEARRTRRFAQQALDGPGQGGRTIQLGVLLPPAEGESAAQTQALFNGVHLAVEAANEIGGRPVRMIFRNTGSNARQAASSLIEAGADAIIGPLFSEQAEAAGQVAEEAGVVLMAPLATDPAVGRDRRYVFQANPSVSMRGRLMARFVVNSLITVDRVGVVGQADNSTSEQMASSFREEVGRLGEQLAFYKLLPNAVGWRNLASQVGTGIMQQADAVYMPIAGNDAETLVSAALSSLDRMDERMRVLGNSAWHGIPVKQQASKHNTTYANVFYVDEERGQVQSFRRRYEELAGRPPSGGVAERLAYTGHDVARFLITSLQKEADQPLTETLHEQPPYQGLGIRLNFENSNMNEALFYLRYRNGQTQVLR